MIAVKFLPLFIFLYSDLVHCYPGTYYDGKRYSRSTHRPSYDDDYYLKSQRYPYSYYPSYGQLYPEEYYYNPDSYPMYYVTPRAPKYDVYKPSLPYYYQDAPVSRVQSKYNYYNYPDPSVDEQERLLQEYEIEQREKSQPIGHEIRYENDYNTEDDEGIDETNAAFLNNLMMQQMYRDKSPSYYDQYPYADYPTDEADAVNFPTRWDDVPYDRAVKVEDEDVKALKDLPKKQKQRKNKQRKQRKLKTNNFDIEENPSKRSENNVVYTDRKPIANAIFSSPVSTEGPKRDARGQKEEVLMRPATPVRHPFSDSVLNMINQQEKRKRSPSVYDTIRHMLEMEKKDEELHASSGDKPEIRETMKKRIVSSEDSLTKQLSVLKKAQ